MAKNLGLELLELRTRFDSELVDEAGSCVLVHLEGLGLPAGAIERKHELAAKRLAQRMLTGESLELADHVAVQPELELGVDALADHDESKLLEPSNLRLREVVECELRERRPAPQRKRGLQKRAPLLRGKPPRVDERVLETTCIDLIRSDVEYVARRACVENVAPQRPAQASDGVLERRGRRLRRLLAPERVDEPVGGDDPAGLEHEDGEERALLGASERDMPGLV